MNRGDPNFIAVSIGSDASVYWSKIMSTSKDISVVE